ncbi:MAG TPA: alpha/beta fold hydrolase, partial [Syntrophales bacterium]|nr:alpha/beta fold hydrolase [Syntrophales bacterium]
VLIARRKRGHRLAGKWEFPGGKLEEGETPEECLRREMMEEFGVDVTVGEFVGRSHHIYPHGAIDLLAYRVTYLNGIYQLHDHEEIRWVYPADLADHDFSEADIPIARLLHGLQATSPEQTPREQFLTINGLQLRVLECGPVKGRPLVLLHGTGDNAHTWDLLAPRLAEHFRVVAVDQRGHGWSSWAVPPAYRCEDYLLDLQALIDQMALDGIFMLGHSMGALHASLYTALNPGKVLALIHVDIEPRPPDWNRKYLSGLYENLPDSYASPEDYISEITKNAPYAKVEDLRNLAAKSLVCRDGRWFRTYDREILASFDHYNLLRNLPAIRCPALVVRGAESRVLGREAARQMVQDLPAGELAEISRATHPAHLDNPEAFREAVMGFLKKHRFI